MRKFMVVLDNSTECLNAMRFAAMRAENTGARVEVLAVIPPEEFNHWIGVAQLCAKRPVIGSMLILRSLPSGCVINIMSILSL